MGWIVTIIIGGLAGFIAEKIMNANMGLLANIGIGILGALVMNYIFGALGISIGGGLVASIIAAVLGACLLIFVYRAIRGRA